MRILMSMFGWNDSGGGTILPRLTALELQKRGHEVLVIYSAVPQIPNAPAYQMREHSDEGVKLIGIHNRPALFMDDKNPERELNDPQVVKIFKHFFDEFQPDIVHYHNFLGLSLGITQVAYEAGVPSFYTPYNFWLLCPTLYLNLPDLSLCQGVNPQGSNCLQCTHAPRRGEAYVQRRDQLRAQFQQQVGPCLASSECVKDLLLHNDYSEDQVEILKFANERSAKIWQEAGQKRQPKINTGTIKIGFTGSVIPIKGVHTLVQAAQQLQGNVEVIVYGKAPEQYLTYLQSLDTHNKVNFAGFFADDEHSKILSELDLAVVPSVCYDHSPLVIGEFLAARTPVIGANIGGIPDYIPAGCGELFEAGNPDALAQVLQQYIDAPERIVNMQKLIQEPLSFDDYVSTLEDRYRLTFIKKSTSIQYEKWQNQREANCIYHARTLERLSLDKIQKDMPPYGLDIWWKTEAFSEQLKAGAHWIMSPSLTAQVKHSYFYFPLAVSGQEQWRIELEPHCVETYLLPLLPEDEEGEQLVNAYFESKYDGESLLVLLPFHQDIESAETALMKILEGRESFPHEIMLIEPPENVTDVKAIVHQISHVLLSSTAQKDELLQILSSISEKVSAFFPLPLPDYWSLETQKKQSFISSTGLRTWVCSEPNERLFLDYVEQFTAILDASPIR